MNGRRRGALAALAAALTLVHLGLAEQAFESRLGAGDAPPRPLEVAFVRTLQPAQPPAVAPLPAAPLPRPRLLAPLPALPASAPALAPMPPLSAPVAEAASAPLADNPASAPLVADATAAPPPAEPASAPRLADAAPAPRLADAASAPAGPDAASAPALARAASPAASAVGTPAAQGFDWPPSTRLSYTLTGDFRGPVEGQARVEWVRQGSRYQVRMTVEVGPPFAPLLSRTSASDGEVGPEGLRPRRYDEETRALLRDPRRLTIHLHEDRIVLPSGRTGPRPPGVQDTASQFVQLTWLFTTRPELLQPGRSVDVPLALPRHVDTWTYDVLAREPLETPFGTLETVHVKPRREPRPGVDLTAELWVAPTLQYLPVRIVIRQDASNHVDLRIRELPLQAAPAGR